MSLNRYAPKRDGNEPAIRARFATHGWHTEQLSGRGLPDLLAFVPRSQGSLQYGFQEVVLVDVKERGGKPTPAQVEKWTALSSKCIPVYVARTEADVDAIVEGRAEPWGVLEARERPAKGKAHTAYAPPRSKPVDAARGAAETFAPSHIPIVHIRHPDGFCTCGAGPEERCG